MPNSASTLCPQHAPGYIAAGICVQVVFINYLRYFEIFGAQGRNRTTDTAIFSRMLYQLSYLGTARAAARERAVYSQARLPCLPCFVSPANRWKIAPIRRLVPILAP
jgi:hypothetical protein